MIKMPNFIVIETKAGQPIQDGKTTITPYSQSLRIQIPGVNGGLIWNRPVSILAASEDGQEEIIPVPDVTRQVLWAIIGAGLGSALILFIISRIRR
jgi:hypothetical protein